MSHSPPSVLVWKNQGSWGTGGNIRTYLVNSDGEVGKELSFHCWKYSRRFHSVPLCPTSANSCFFFFFKLSLLMLGRIMLWLLLINVPLSQWSSRYRKVNQTSCSCCLSCWQFCGSTLCRNGSTGQGRRVICTNRKLSDLELKLENWLKYCLNIFWIHVPSCCGYLLFPCSGWLVPLVEICICNFKAASAQKNFLLLRSVQK